MGPLRVVAADNGSWQGKRGAGGGRKRAPVPQGSITPLPCCSPLPHLPQPRFGVTPGGPVVAEKGTPCLGGHRIKAPHGIP